MDCGHIDMRKLGELLIAASDMPKYENGMVISATGALTIAARVLNEMAEPFDDHDSGDELREAHQERVTEAQPRLSAYTLETLAEHIAMLREAVSTGNADVVGRFFNLYVFE
jgi:hypothetical protein